MTNLVIFPPTLLLVELFRRIKKRETRITALKKLLKNKNLLNQEGEFIIK